MVFYPRLAVLNVPETSVHDYTRITHADGSTFLTNYPPVPAGEHDGLVTVAGPEIRRSTRPGQATGCLAPAAHSNVSGAYCSPPALVQASSFKRSTTGFRNLPVSPVCAAVFSRQGI